MRAYDKGRHAARLQLAPSLNPYAEHTHDAIEWSRGWLRATGEQLRAPSPPGTALVLPHPSMTGEQIDLLCRREGLALARLGRERFVLVQTGNRPQTMLRIASSAPEAA